MTHARFKNPKHSVIIRYRLLLSGDIEIHPGPLSSRELLEVRSSRLDLRTMDCGVQETVFLELRVINFMLHGNQGQKKPFLPLFLLNSLCNEETVFFYIGFSKPWPSLPFQMHRCVTLVPNMKSDTSQWLVNPLLSYHYDLRTFNQEVLLGVFGIPDIRAKNYRDTWCLREKLLGNGILLSSFRDSGYSQKIVTYQMFDEKRSWITKYRPFSVFLLMIRYKWKNM